MHGDDQRHGHTRLCILRHIDREATTLRSAIGGMQHTGIKPRFAWRSEARQKFIVILVIGIEKETAYRRQHRSYRIECLKRSGLVAECSIRRYHGIAVLRGIDEATEPLQHIVGCVLERCFEVSQVFRPAQCHKRCDLFSQRDAVWRHRLNQFRQIRGMQVPPGFGQHIETAEQRWQQGDDGVKQLFFCRFHWRRSHHVIPL